MRKTGDLYEGLAKQFLEKNGLSTIKCNFTCRSGEIDIVMKEQDTIVFVEVRYRASASFGSALESISASKQRKISRAANMFLQKYNLFDIPCRFDTVTFDESKRDRSKPIWIRSAFEGQE